MHVDISVPDGKSGDWKVETFIVSKKDAEFHNMRAAFSPGGRFIEEGTYKKLCYKDRIVMSNTPAEISDHLHFIFKAKESKTILINGLGLGVCLAAVLESDIPDSITVIEKSEDVINLVAPTFKSDNRVNIIHDDAFIYKPPKGIRYNAVWHDIWPYICADNLPEMTKLHRRYGKRTDWQDSWCKELCKRYR